MNYDKLAELPQFTVVNGQGFPSRATYTRNNIDRTEINRKEFLRILSALAAAEAIRPLRAFAGVEGNAAWADYKDTTLLDLPGDYPLDLMLHPSACDGARGCGVYREIGDREEEAVNMSKVIGIVALLFAAASCVAAETARGLDRTFGDRRLAVTVSGETGFPVAYAVDGRTVVTATDARQPFVLKENWYAVTNDGTWRVESVSFETNVLRTVTRAGRWLVGQELTLFPEVRRVRRVFTLEWTADAPAKLRGFDVDGGTMRLGAAGGYRLPCVLPVVDVASAALRPGVSHETYESPFSVLAVDGAGQGVSWVVDDARPYCDTGFTRVTERSGAIAVTSPFDCAGYVCQGSRETVGDLWMCFGRQDSVEAVLRDLPKWFEQVGQRVVEGRPEWIRQGVVYSMHPCGTRVSQWRDWGGFLFSTTQVKRIAELGANTIWLLPIESASPYFPFDYHRLADNVGTTGDYRAFVAETRRNGLRLFRDIVPHGGTDTCPRAKEHPEWLLRDERGGTAGSAVGFEPDSRYWVFDMGNPEWCAYMSDVAKAYLADGLDGLRIDACGGSPRPNWDAGIRGRRASLSRRAAGLRMQAAIREGARKSNPEAVMLAEGDLSAFATTSDVLYDWSLAFRGLRAFATADAATVVDGVRRYLNDEVYSQVPGHLRLRYQSNHDCLHSELVYGGAAHLANYALLAWMPGVAFVYQEEEFGHSDALREIYRVRREIPELTLGTPKSTAGFGVKQFDALWECEAQVRFERRGSGLRLVFEGELRDRSRFGLPTSALPYAVAYAFDGDGSFAVTPSAAITDCVGRNGGLLFFELERGEPCAPVPKRSVSGFFGRKAKVVSDDALLFKAMWLDREVTALRAHEPSGFTLKLDFTGLSQGGSGVPARPWREL